MIGHGARVERAVGTAGIGGEGGQAHLGGHVAGQRAKQGPQPLGIPPPPIHPLHIHLPHLLEVVAGGPGCRRQGSPQLGRPAASADQLGQIRHRQALIGAARGLPRQQRRERHAALAGADLQKGHGPQPQEGEAAGSGVACGVIGRHRRPGEQKLPWLPARIHRPPHLVPERRFHLPFIKQARPGSRQHQGRIHRQRLAGRGVHIQEHRRGGQLLGHAGLAAGLGTFDHHRASRSQTGSQLIVGDAGAIAGGHSGRSMQQMMEI